MPARPCCMVVEDQALIALAIEAHLEDAGFAVAGPFESGARALVWLEGAAPSVAVLDVVLRDRSCLDLAEALRRRGIPFVVHSGLDSPSPKPPELGDAPWLVKPARSEDLLDTLAGLLAKAGAPTGSAAAPRGSAGARRSRATRRSPSRP